MAAGFSRASGISKTLYRLKGRRYSVLRQCGYKRQVVVHTAKNGHRNARACAAQSQHVPGADEIRLQPTGFGSWGNAWHKWENRSGLCHVELKVAIAILYFCLICCRALKVQLALASSWCIGHQEARAKPQTGAQWSYLRKASQVDAFASEAFKGNPAAVCLMDGANAAASDELLQQIAADNLSETAYIYAPEGADFSSSDRFTLRWFTPQQEVDLCGDATLASAAVLFQGAPAQGSEGAPLSL